MPEERVQRRLAAILVADVAGYTSLVNANETETIAADRAARRAWLESRGYAVIDIRAGDVEADLAGELARLEASLTSNC